MKILLTGGTGFFGSHLLKSLVDNGHKVVLIKKKKSQTWRIKDSLSKIEVFNIDQYSIVELNNRHNDVDVCIHAATEYGRDGENLKNLIEANLFLPFKVLLFAINTKCSHFINTETFYSLANSNFGYLKDYIQSKKHFKEWGEKAAIQNKIQFTNMRLFHLYGPMDNIDKFTNSMIDRLLENKTIDLTQGTQLRDFIFVEDAVRAFINVIENKPEDEVNNFDVGTGKNIMIRDFVQEAHNLIGSQSKLNFGAIPRRENEPNFPAAHIEELLKIGWNPRMSLRDGITKILNSKRSLDL
jgi:nucleoside-diphosphate-sugar epimerase